MAAYALVEITINDMEKMGPYMEKVEKTVADHGGRYLVRAGETTVVEGNIGEHPLKVILEFPDMAAAKGWYDSAEYQAIVPHRTAASASNFLFVEGV